MRDNVRAQMKEETNAFATIVIFHIINVVYVLQLSPISEADIVRDIINEPFSNGAMIRSFVIVFFYVLPTDWDNVDRV